MARYNSHHLMARYNSHYLMARVHRRPSQSPFTIEHARRCRCHNVHLKFPSMPLGYTADYSSRKSHRATTPSWPSLESLCKATSLFVESQPVGKSHWHAAIRRFSCNRRRNTRCSIRCNHPSHSSFNSSLYKRRYDRCSDRPSIIVVLIVLL